MKYKNENGGYAVLFIVMIVNAAALTVATSIMIWGFYFHKTSLVQLESIQARNLADACGEHALQLIRNNYDYIGTDSINLAEGSCSYTVSGVNPNKEIKTTGYINDVTRRLILSIDKTDPAININSWKEVADF